MLILVGWDLTNENYLDCTRLPRERKFSRPTEIWVFLLVHLNLNQTHR
jgi:hypothetical protein